MFKEVARPAQKMRPFSLSYFVFVKTLMMKKTFFYAVVLLLFYSCSSNNGNNNSSGQNSKMTFGAPPARVSDQPNAERAIKGPLAYAPNIPKMQDADTVDVKFDVVHRIFHVTASVAFTAWMFGDSLPGPVLRIRVGQTVRFSMTDRSNEEMGVAMNMSGAKANRSLPHSTNQPMPHSIDFHAAMVNPADKYRSIQPGETISFTWTANYPGVFMYHCGTPMVLMHMISGMVGMVIVEPKEGYPGKVDHEFAFVQNEYYLKQTGAVYSPDTSKSRIKQPTFVTFNGKAGQYMIHPIHVKAGQRIRAYILNAGPNNATSFHVIGTILDKVWYDGNPKNEMVGMQAVYLGPASGAVVEFVLPEKGSYTFVDHSFADAEMGAIGVFQAD
jgi:nitrite reductase (NO-forming)